MNLIQTEISSYAESLEDFKPEYVPVKVNSVVEFFHLRGRTTSMIKSNVEFIPDLHYCYLSPVEKRFYFKSYKCYDLDTLFFYRPTLTFSGQDEAIEQLRTYVLDGNVWLLLTAEQIADTSAMLERLWNAQFKDRGKLDYRSYTKLLKASLDYEDYKDYGKALTGYRTVCNQYEKSISAIWDEAYRKAKA
jgi:hypothetical protein